MCPDTMSSAVRMDLIPMKRSHFNAARVSQRRAVTSDFLQKKALVFFPLPLSLSLSQLHHGKLLAHTAKMNTLQMDF